MVEQKERPPLSEAQMEIMTIVWERGEVTVADVWNELSRRRSVARNTVMTMMKRLEEKGWLRHRVEGNKFLYRAGAERDKTLRRLVSNLVDTAFGGSADDLVMALLDGRGVSPEEAARIRRMIEKAEKDS